MRIKQGDYVSVHPSMAVGKGLARVTRINGMTLSPEVDVKYEDGTTQRVYAAHLSTTPELLRKGLAKKAEEAQKIGRNVRR